MNVPSVAPGRERRRHHRHRQAIGDITVVSGGDHIVVHAEDVVDISLGGVFVRMAPLPLGQTVSLHLAGLTVPGRVVRVRLDGRRRGQSVPTGLAVAFAEPRSTAWEHLLSTIAAAQPTST